MTPSEWLGLATLLVSSALTYWMGIHPRLVAKKQLFDRPGVAAALNNCKDSEIVYIAPLKDGHVLLADFDVTVGNTGRASARNLYVSIEMPESIYGADLPRSCSSASITLHKIERALDTITGTQIVRITYLIPALHPGTSYTLQDTVYFKSQNTFEREVDLKSADGVAMRVGYSLSFHYAVKIVVTMENNLPIGAKYGVDFYKPDHPMVKNVLISEEKMRALLPDITSSTEPPKFATVFQFEETKRVFHDGEAVRGLRKVVFEDAKKSRARWFKNIGYVSVRSARS